MGLKEVFDRIKNYNITANVDERLSGDRFLFYYDLFDIYVPSKVCNYVALNISDKLLKFIYPFVKFLVKIEDVRFHAWNRFTGKYKNE